MSAELIGARIEEMGERAISRICDEREHHSLVSVMTLEWPYDVLVCEDCEFAIQVERDEEPEGHPDIDAPFRNSTGESA